MCDSLLGALTYGSMLDAVLLPLELAYMLRYL